MSEKPSRFSILTKILVAVAGPALGGLGGLHWIREHPIWAIILLTLYELAVYILGEIWIKVKDRWLTKIADWIARWVETLIQDIFSGYRREYLEHLCDFCNDLDVTWLRATGSNPLNLLKVIVEVPLRASPPHEVPVGVVPNFPQALNQGSHSIWEYLRSGRSRFVILGPAGSGKTTLLRSIALQTACVHRNRAPEKVPKRIPILLSLRDYAAGITMDGDFSLGDAISSSYVVKNMDVKCPEGWFDRQLKRGRCLVLLDGLDELGDCDVRGQVAHWIQKQMHRHLRNVFILTSRPYGYREKLLSEVTTLAIRPFTLAQVRTFISNWHHSRDGSRGPSDGLCPDDSANDSTKLLMDRILVSDSLTELAASPLLLTIIAALLCTGPILYLRRSELLQEMCEVLLKSRHNPDEVKQTIGLSVRDKLLVLQSIAYTMMRAPGLTISVRKVSEELRLVFGEGGSPVPSAEDFCGMIEDSSGLLVKRNDGLYEFAHRAFQEYLAAAHCRAQSKGKELATRVTDGWWHETILLYVAHSDLPVVDITPIIEACLSNDPLLSESLVLAAQCLEESSQVDLQWRQQVELLLRSEKEDEKSQKVCSEALISLHLRRMTPLDGKRTWITGQPTTNAEYQVFLDDMRKRENKYHQPDHWQSFRFASGTGGYPVTGIRFSDAEAFCNWLSNRNPTWIYRVPKSKEIRLGAEFPKDQRQTGVVGCWATDPEGEPVIEGMLDEERERFFREARAFLGKQVLHDESLRQIAGANFDELSVRIPSHLLERFRMADPLDSVRLPDWLFEQIGEHIPALLDLERSLTSDLDSALERGRAYNRIQRLDPRSALDPIRIELNDETRKAMDKALDRTVSGLDRALALAHARAAVLLLAGIWPLMRYKFRQPMWQDLLNSLHSWIGSNRARPDSSAASHQARIDMLCDRCVDLYIQLALIEARREDKIANIGGIRVVREKLESN